MGDTVIQDNYQDKYVYVMDVLAKRGEISEEEIRSLSIFTNKLESRAIIEALKHDFNLKIVTKKISEWPMLEWQKVFRISP